MTKQFISDLIAKNRNIRNEGIITGMAIAFFLVAVFVMII